MSYTTQYKHTDVIVIPKLKCLERAIKARREHIFSDIDMKMANGAREFAFAFYREGEIQIEREREKNLKNEQQNIHLMHYFNGEFRINLPGVCCRCTRPNNQTMGKSN